MSTWVKKYSIWRENSLESSVCKFVTIFPNEKSILSVTKKSEPNAKESTEEFPHTKMEREFYSFFAGLLWGTYREVLILILKIGAKLIYRLIERRNGQVLEISKVQWEETRKIQWFLVAKETFCDKNCGWFRISRTYFSSSLIFHDKHVLKNSKTTSPGVWL